MTSDRWRAFAPIVARVPLLPTSDVPQHSYARALQCHRAYRERRDVERRAAGRIADDIGAVVPRATPRARRALLALRRAAFADRVPPPQWQAAVADACPELTAAVESWLCDVAACTALAEARDAAFAREQTAATAKLLVAYAEGAPLEVAVTLAHPSLEAKIRRCLTAPALSRRTARTLDVLWRFWWRAAFRPTPFGLFASWVLPERWLPEGAQPARAGRRLTISARPDALRQLLSARRMVETFAAGRLTLSASIRLGETEASQLVEDGNGTLSFKRVPDHAVALLSMLDARPRRPHAVADLLAGGIARSLLVQACVESWCRWDLEGDGQDGTVPDLVAVLRRLWREAVYNPAALTAVADVDSVHAASQSALTNRTQDTAHREIVGTLSMDSFAPMCHPPRLSPVCADLAKYGSALGLSRPALERRAFRSLLNAVSPGSAPRMCLVDFINQAQRWLSERNIPGSTLRHPLRLAELLGLAEPEVDVLAAQLLQHWQREQSAAVLEPWLSPLLTPGNARRAACRLMPSSRDGDSAALIALWGGDRMSLIPRVGRHVPALIEVHANWMAQWPNAVDIVTGRAAVPDARRPTTRRVVTGPRASIDDRSLRLWDLEICARGADDCLLQTGDGTPVDPVYFGLTGPAAQPTWVAVGLSLGPAAWSGVDLAYAALARAVSAHITGPVTALPSVWLTPRLQLVPAGWVIDPESLPPIRHSSAAQRLFAFRDWADAHALPETICAISATDAIGEPSVVDLGHPEGVALFQQLAGATSSWLFIRALARQEPRPASASREPSHAMEYYVEVTADA